MIAADFIGVPTEEWGEFYFDIEYVILIYFMLGWYIYTL